MATLNEIRDVYRLEATATGQDAVAAAAGKIANSNQKIATSADAVVTSSERQERRVISLTKAVEQFNARNDAHVRLQQQVARGQDLLNRAFEQGLSETESYRRGVEILAQQQARLAEMNDRAAASTRRLADAQRVQTTIDGSVGVRVDFGTEARGADIAAYGAELDKVRAKYDPVFRAGQQYRAGLAELRQALAAGALSEAAYSAELDRRKTAFVEQVRGLGKISAAERDAAAAARAATEALAVQTAALSKSQSQWATLSNQGAAQEKAFQGSEKIAAQFRAMSAQGAAQARALGQARDGYEQVGRSAQVADHHITNLTAQISDVVASLASGSSPFTILLQQGGQIGPILGETGVGGALGAIRDKILGLITPTRLAVGGLLGIGVAAIASAVQFTSAQNGMRNALLGTGQAAGLTVTELDEIARKAADSGKVTIGAARDIEKAFLRSGEVAGEAFLPGILAVASLAKATGTDTAQAADRLAQSLGQLGSGGLEDLAKQAGNFDVAFTAAVRELLASGREAEAQIRVVNRLNEAYKQAGDNAAWYQRAWQGTLNGVSTMWDALGRRISGAGDTVAEQIRKLEAAAGNRVAIGEAEAKAVGGSYSPDSDPQVRALRQRAEDLRRQMQASSDEARKTGEQTRANVSQLQQRVVDATVPDMARFRNIPQQIAEVSSALGQAADSGASKQTIDGLRLSLDRLKAAQEDVTKAGGPARLEERKALELSLARGQALRAVTPEEQASAAAATKRAEAFATMASATERNRVADEAYRDTLAQNAQQTANRVRITLQEAETSDRFTDALKNSSQSVAAVTAARRAADAVAEGSISKTQEQAVREAELRKELSATERAIAERVRSQRDATEQTRADIAAVQAGTKTSEQAAQQAAGEAQRRRDLREASAAEGEQRRRIVETIKAEAAAQRENISAQAAQTAVGMTEQTERQIKAVQDEIAVVAKSREEQARTIATRQAILDLMRAGVPIQSAEGQAYIATQQRLAGYRTELSKAYEQQQRLMEGQRAIGDAFTTFIEGLVSGSGRLTDALSALARTFTSGGLQAILSGTGPFAEMFGTASGDPNKAGGLLGGILPGLKDAVKTGTQAGSATGTVTGFGNLLESFDTKQVVGVVGGAMGIAGAYGAGAQAKSTGGAALAGALSGGIGGFMLGAQLGAGLGPIGAVAGAAIGGLMGILGNNAEKERKKREQQQQYRDQYEQAKPQIETLSRTLRGSSTTGAEATIEAARLQMIQAIQTAAKAGDQATATRIEQEWNAYAGRLREQVRATIGGIEKEISAGFGTSGPYAQAASQVRALAESMRGWLDDVNRATDTFDGDALDAIFRGLLATLQPTPELSQTAREFARIQGTAAALQQELTRLSGSAEGAAAAIREGVTRALDTLRASFNADLDAKINDARGQGYLNDVRDLLKEVSGLRLDASLVGGDLGRVDTYFAAAAQKIVNESQLTGEAFSALVTQYPALNGLVREYSAALADQASTLEQVAERIRGYQDRLFAATNDANTEAGALAAFQRQAEQDRAAEVKAGGQGLADLEKAQAAERLNIVRDFAERAAAAEKAIADRRMGFADRLFAAQNDTSTLAGQLAAFDRRAEQERQAEIAAGGQAIADLEAAQYAERLKLVVDYQSQAADAERQRMEAAQQAFDTFARNIRTFVDGLRAGSASPLSPQARLAAAQSQYSAQLTLAQGGDRTALDGITAYASDLLDAAKGFYASSAAFQAIFGQVTGQLTALPTQVSAEQFIVNAIDASKTATVAATQAMQAALKTAIDAGNGASVAAALLPQFNTLTATTGGLLNYSQFVSATGGLATASEQQAARAIFNSLDRNNDGQLSKLELINGQVFATAGNTGQTKNAVDYLGAVNLQQKGLLDAINSWSAATQTNTGNTKSAIDGLNTLNAQQKSLLDQVNTWTNATYTNVLTSNSIANGQTGILQSLQALNQQISSYTNNTWTQLNGVYDVSFKSLQNLQAANGKNGAAVYASGGLVTGPGTGTSDSIAARLSNGEFVLTAEATRRLGVPFLDALNDNRMAMPAVAMPLPMPVAAGMGSGALVAEMQALRAEVSALRKERQQGDRMVAGAVVAGAEHVADHVDRTTDAVEDGQRTAAALAA